MARNETDRKIRGDPTLADEADTTGMDPYDIYPNDWRFSKEAIEKRIPNEAKLYTTNLRHLGGMYVAKYYGLWSIELEEGTVYMMVLEYLDPAEAIVDTKRGNILGAVQ